jgi:hypothetical protein
MTAIQVEEALPDSDPLTALPAPGLRTGDADTTEAAADRLQVAEAETEPWVAYKQDDGIVDPVAVAMAVPEYSENPSD